MNITVPSESEMETIEKTTPVFIPNLTAGLFEGLIEEIEFDTDKDTGQVISERFTMIIRVSKTGNPEHIGKLMKYTHYIKDRKNNFIPNSYRFLTVLDPSIKDGGEWNPSNLILVEFRSQIKYSGKFWNFTESEFIEKHKDFGISV